MFEEGSEHMWSAHGSVEEDRDRVNVAALPLIVARRSAAFGSFEAR
jgi:hypothetical protein